MRSIPRESWAGTGTEWRPQVESLRHLGLPCLTLLNILSDGSFGSCFTVEKTRLATGYPRPPGGDGAAGVYVRCRPTQSLSWLLLHGPSHWEEAGRVGDGKGDFLEHFLGVCSSNLFSS